MTTYSNCARWIGSTPSPADWGVSLQEAKITDETEDLFNASLEDVLAVNIFHCVTFTASAAQSMDDLVYYRFGFSLNEYPYSGVPPVHCLMANNLITNIHHLESRWLLFRMMQYMYKCYVECLDEDGEQALSPIFTPSSRKT